MSRNSKSEADASAWMQVNAQNAAAEAARWEAMAAQARKGMAVHEPKELMTADDRKLLRRIYAGLAVFWIVTISAGVYWIYRAH